MTAKVTSSASLSLERDADRRAPGCQLGCVLQQLVGGDVQCGGEGVQVGATYLHAVASLDGYIADERDDVGPLHDWYFNGDHPSSTTTTPMFTVRHSGSQWPRLTTCVACGRARRSWSSGGTNST
jgi:hypothetical protein